MTAIALGIPFVVTFIPWGALFFADANTYESDDYPSDAESSRRVGRALLGLGLTGAASVGLGVWRLIVQRRRRQKADASLREISMRRTMLEQMLEWQYTSAATTRGAVTSTPTEWAR